MREKKVRFAFSHFHDNTVAVDAAWAAGSAMHGKKGERIVSKQMFCCFVMLGAVQWLVLVGVEWCLCGERR
jgi:hypothetical protein